MFHVKPLQLAQKLMFHVKRQRAVPRGVRPFT